MGYLDNVRDEHAFYLDGKYIHNLKELAKELRIINEGVFKRHVDEHNDLHNWVNHIINDHKLAGKIKNLTLKKNFIRVIEERITFLEKLKLGVESDRINVSLNTHDKEIVFSVDKEKCCLCDICKKVCPQEAIEVDGNPLSIKVNNKCVLCGFCVPFCPVFALDITIDGKKKNPMEDTEAIPVFEEPVDINGVKVNRFLEGTIKINNSIIPDDCEGCVSACPTLAIKREGEELVINEDYCFYCGACVLACKEGITLKRSRIIYKNGFCSNWNDAIERLIGKHYINLDHDSKSGNKILKLIRDNKDFAKYNVQADITKEVPELQDKQKEKEAGC